MRFIVSAALLAAILGVVSSAANLGIYREPIKYLIVSACLLRGDSHLKLITFRRRKR